MCPHPPGCTWCTSATENTPLTPREERQGHIAAGSTRWNDKIGCDSLKPLPAGKTSLFNSIKSQWLHHTQPPKTLCIPGHPALFPWVCSRTWNIGIKIISWLTLLSCLFVVGFGFFHSDSQSTSYTESSNCFKRKKIQVNRHKAQIRKTIKKKNKTQPIYLVQCLHVR